MLKASIIIPSYNACERLYYNLLSLSVQNCDKDKFEVIVVDDGSKDSTRKMLAGFNTNFNIKKIVLNENRGRAYARNTAINEAKGDILIFHDSDMVAEKDYVAKHINAHTDSGTVVSGMNWRKVYSYYYEDFAEAAKQKLESQLSNMGIDMRLVNKQPILSEAEITSGKIFDYTFSQSKYQSNEDIIINSYGSSLEGYHFPWIFFVTNNCSAFREDVLKAGGFDNNFLAWGCEDLDLGYRLYRNNCRFIKAIDITSIHQEHPINHKNSVSDNIYFFTKKFDSIDLLLFYYGSYAGIKNYTANAILSELEKFEGDGRYEWVAELYRRLLINLRESNYRCGRNKNIQEVRQLRDNVISDSSSIQAVLFDLENERMLLNTASSFRTLLRKVLGPNIKALKI